jgi:hypothetical protein
LGVSFDVARLFAVALLAFLTIPLPHTRHRVSDARANGRGQTSACTHTCAVPAVRTIASARWTRVRRLRMAAQR